MWVPLVVIMAMTPGAVRLEYASRAESCPDDATLRALVEKRLGYAPWAEPATRIISVEVGPSGAGLAARVVMRDADGDLLGERALSSSRSDCVELSAALVLAISIAIDPRSAFAPRPKPAPPPPPPPRIVLAIPDEKPPPPVIPRRTAWTLRYGTAAGIVVDTGLAPLFATGAFGRVALQLRDVSVGAEASAHVPTTRFLKSGHLEVASALSSVVGCFHAGWLAACGSASAGALTARTLGLVGATTITAPQMRLGLRAGVDLPLLPVLRVTTSIMANANLLRVRLRDSSTGEAFWEQPAAGVGAQLGISLRFP